MSDDMAKQNPERPTLAALARRQEESERRVAELAAENRALREELRQTRNTLEDRNMTRADTLRKRIHAQQGLLEQTVRDLRERYRQLEARVAAKERIVNEATGRFNGIVDEVNGIVAGVSERAESVEQELADVKQQADHAVEQVKALLALPRVAGEAGARPGIGPSALPLLPDHIIMALSYDAEQCLEICLVRDDNVLFDLDDHCA
jgi:predicted nuclease with TOPRIM domain